MEIFTITETFWDESKEELIDTGKVIGYRATTPTGKTLAEGETIEEATEKALTVMYLNESNPAPKKLKLGHGVFNPKMSPRPASVAK